MPANNPLTSWTVDRADIRFVGQDLQRPECILAEPDGTLWTADARGGVVRIDTDGSQTLIAQTVAAETETTGGERTIEQLILEGSLPNGLAFDRDGNIIIANFGTDAIELMTRDGQSRTLYDSIEGQPLGKANFVLTDSRGWIWFTVTTRRQPWTLALNEQPADGYVGVIDDKGIRIVADGFVGTNEIRFDANEEWLYVAETIGRRISRLRIDRQGAVTDREIFGPSDLKGYPDGFAIDSHGNLWIALIINERLVALTPEGDVLTLLNDGKPEALAEYHRHHDAKTITPAMMGACAGELAPLMASITFGGPDLKTVYLGSLMGHTLPCFRSPVAGLPPAHWR